jgi:putative transposase
MIKTMPSKNRVKDYLPDSYYHLYNRGVNKRVIFKDTEDYSVFLNLLKRYLSKEPIKDTKGREYDWLYERMELLCFCLMPNHFHLLIYQNDEEAMTKLMRGVLTSYTAYFNKKYKRIGPLFQDRFKASRIMNDSYLLHISRYIHLNPTTYKTWEFSIYQYYLGNKHAEWVRPERILDLFEGGSYTDFVADYRGYKQQLDDLKHELANASEL